MENETPRTEVEKDRIAYQKVDAGTVQESLAYAAKKSGRSVLQIAGEFSKLSRGPNKIAISEYIRWGLFYEDRFTEKQRGEFISNTTHWPIAHTCNNQGWSSAAEDKVLAATILSRGGVSVPETVAVIDASARIYPGITKISTPDELRDLFLGLNGEKLFGKIVDGMVSFGVFSVVSADENHIVCAGHEPMTYADFMSSNIGENAYILQKTLNNHADIAPFCSALATVRVVNFVKDGTVYSPIAVMSMPQGTQIADTLWRSGNIACEIDVFTGEVKTVVTREGPEIAFLKDHPTVAGWMGKKLPWWDALMDMNERAAQIFSPIRYQSTDIAITDAGPVIVELNYGSGFGLPQNASGRGLLTPEVRAFFEECGVSFEAKKKSKFKLFGK